MNDPIKIIFKYKNNYKRVQYNTYIFIGNISEDVKQILKKIEMLKLYDTFIKLSNAEITKLEKFYGVFWYKKFFNTYHINNTILQINENTDYEKELINKYGKDWFNVHIIRFDISDKKIIYNYGTYIKNEYLSNKKKQKNIEKDIVMYNYQTVKKKDNDRLNMVKTKKMNVDKNILHNNQVIDTSLDTDTESYTDSSDYDVPQSELFSNIINTMDKYDYKITNKIHQSFHTMENQFGGDESTIDVDADTIMGSIDIDSLSVTPSKDEMSDDLYETIPSHIDGNDLDADEIEKLYKGTEEVDKTVDKTTELIKKALDDDNIIKKAEKKIPVFNSANDNVMFDQTLQNVYHKIYITDQYIYKDDTIKTIKNKICVSIKNNSKFGNNSFIIPSRQYLWSEYIFDTKIDKVIIGHKWIKKVELINIDVEPNTNIHVYEELRNNLALLKENIKKFGSKIKLEYDEHNILYDYEGYFTNNDIYMIDIYNELGRDYSTEDVALKNIFDVYVKVYFPMISFDELKDIIEYLNDRKSNESTKMSDMYNVILNDLILENEIMGVIENIKKHKKYENLLDVCHITNSTLHVNIKPKDASRIDLFRIFNSFELNETYPFIQYQSTDGQIAFIFHNKYIKELHDSKTGTNILHKWFENAPYGISFKVRIPGLKSDKFTAINLSETGRLEYKTQWKEIDLATNDDVIKTFDYIRELIKKINSEDNNIIFELPINEEFKYAFMNTIQRFILPDKFTINHNHLSELASYLYPYAAVEIEPRKRQSKQVSEHKKGKFGTYLRYKRVSKYENQFRIEQRILYYLKNYEFDLKILSDEISKQFNVTMEKAVDYINSVRNKFTNIRKSRKVLKKMENLPKYKSPGIDINIQGKDADKYKFRISGVRNYDQLNRIISFYGALIYLYIDIYYNKNQKMIDMQNKLKKLTNIAKRRNKVDVIVSHERKIKSIKALRKVDDKRIAFRAKEGQSQYSRLCQNSGKSKKRQPYTIMSKNELLKNGFKMDEKTGTYVKNVNLAGKKSKKKSVTIRAVGLEGNDGEVIYWTCDPKINNPHIYIGFLSRSSNPYGACMPCCFKKDQLTAANKKKEDYYLQCVGKLDRNIVRQSEKSNIGDKIYVLQDTNKIQDGRVGFLPKYLDYFFNSLLGNDKKIKKHYLIETRTGYFFKYGSEQKSFQFMNSVCACLDMTLETVKNKIVQKLKNDKTDNLFTTLNNGDIKTSFKTRDKYIDFILNNKFLDFDTMNHIMSIPDVLVRKGLNIIVFKKINIVISKELEKDTTIDDFVIVNDNTEEHHNIIDPDRINILIVKEASNYFPICFVTMDKPNKTFKYIQTFTYENKNDNIIKHIYDFYIKNIEMNTFLNTNMKLSAKTVYTILNNIDAQEFKPKFQIIDSRNKCKYIITYNSTVVPVNPSGSVYGLQILKNIDLKIMSFEETLHKLKKVYDKLTDKIAIKPIGVYYDQKYDNKNDTSVNDTSVNDTSVNGTSVNVIGIMTQSGMISPVKPERILVNKLNKMGLLYEYKQLYDKVDIQLEKENYKPSIDERIKQVTKDKFQNEAYQLFRLHFSHYINNPERVALKKKIMNIIKYDKTNNSEKIIQLKTIIFKYLDKELYNIYVKKHKSNDTDEVQEGGADKFINITNNIPNLDKYEPNNIRSLCQNYNGKDKCVTNMHCHWTYDSCRLNVTKKMFIIFVSKVSAELVADNHQTYEILMVNDCYVSDVVDNNVFEERDNATIIKSSSASVNKVLEEIFGKENIPIIGKKKLHAVKQSDIVELNSLHPPKNFGNYLTQTIIDGNIGLFRAFSNGYVWVKHTHYNIENRNLGYYSNLQTDLSNYFRGNVINYIADKNNKDTLLQNIGQYFNRNNKNFIIELINNISNNSIQKTPGVIEMYTLNKLYAIPIIVTNNLDDVVYVFDDGLIYDKFKEKNKNDVMSKYKNKNKYIHIKFVSFVNGNIPGKIEVVYYR